MTISIDSNVIAALWNNDDPFNAIAVQRLGQARALGKLVVPGPVYSELLAGPLRNEAALDRFFAETDITVDWTLGEEIWREAGRVYRAYVLRRSHSGGRLSRRILTDFLIGAHALVRGYTLLTFDQRLYATAFPTLTVLPD
jgi:predicted nucleic acid-binding protein